MRRKLILIVITSLLITCFSTLVIFAEDNPIISGTGTGTGKLMNVLGNTAKFIFGDGFKIWTLSEISELFLASVDIWQSLGYLLDLTLSFSLALYGSFMLAFLYIFVWLPGKYIHKVIKPKKNSGIGVKL